jgi:hypothetical protein
MPPEKWRSRVIIDEGERHYSRNDIAVDDDNMATTLRSRPPRSPAALTKRHSAPAQENRSMLIRNPMTFQLLAVCAALVVSTSHSSAQDPVPATPVPPVPSNSQTAQDDGFMDDRDATDCPSPEDAQSQFKALSEIRVGLHLEGKQLPPDCSQNVFHGTRMSVSRRESLIDFNWASANFFHRPLYFEDTPLERYGQSVSPHLQPIISGGRFFLTLPILPYKMGADHPHDCVTTLGYYRPGICAPCVMQVPPPIEWDAALLQAGTTVGLVLLLP